MEFAEFVLFNKGLEFEPKSGEISPFPSANLASYDLQLIHFNIYFLALWVISLFKVSG